MQLNARSIAASVRPVSSARRSAVLVRADGQINPAIRKTEEKVVDMVKVADLGAKAVFCRCWKSEKFPYCDGKHVAHNKATGDNVGPLIVENPK